MLRDLERIVRIIAGAFGGRTLRTVEGPGYRPAMGRTREALFSMLEARGAVWPACAALDLFAGSGSLAFEALSRGAASAMLVESSPRAVDCLRANARALGLDEGRCRIVAQETARVLAVRPRQAFDVAFIDPPYGKNLLSPALRALARNGWVAEGGMVAAEVEAEASFDPAGYVYLEPLAERVFGRTRIILWKAGSPV